jgi:hypothetical protein
MLHHQENLADTLLIGAETGDEKAVERALKSGVDPNKVSGRNGFTPLHHGTIACCSVHPFIRLGESWHTNFLSISLDFTYILFIDSVHLFSLFFFFTLIHSSIFYDSGC